ncbi:MAG: tetraacyldisaccharide 4'-kinase [Bacteroidales bacterium]|nr:tetraacyldisaccharide 4'-kinase [Bacteroidales bacterium]NCU36599.1 tetraacyldisaccharide 4'-kinase [Candidatus Falkowbacteria bacterium]MDD2633180.1 tetraacyldisaccharide 4'-kinase [Bacteroidales bacterium]MDD3132254.1 tetraacyldisaccharide 4'-kinase [Bacteroidales bacterium]MDD3525454.1 tetraacyldisaccharide 4'-kinase [Bacteroidales bacterium]
MRIFLFLLYPFALLYGLLLMLRNKAYDCGWLKSKRFDLPVISVGNLSMGGTGKTPHVEYLIKLLKGEHQPAVVSRGYKRKSRGFVMATPHSTSADIGDEPLQISRKFPEITVAVDGNRVRGISKVLQKQPATDVILLDDAFQHRAVKPGLSILLTDFHNLYAEDYPVPVGTLREFRGGARRADIIIITKSGRTLSPITVRRINDLLKPRPHQQLFFSYISYGPLTPLPGSSAQLPAEKVSSVLLFAGIANIYPLKEHVVNITNYQEIIEFGDHHRYTEKDYQKIRKQFENLFMKNKIIITTEKDAMRIAIPQIPELLADLPVFYIPIEIKIHTEFRKCFNDQIRNYVRSNTGNSSIPPQ